MVDQQPYSNGMDNYANAPAHESKHMHSRRFTQAGILKQVWRLAIAS